MFNFSQFRALLTRELKELYDTQDQVMALLPDLIYASHDSKLEAVLTRQLGQTLRQKKRLAEALTFLGTNPRGRISRCMRALIEETRSVAHADRNPPERDLMLIIMTQRIAHLQICAYGSARMLARILVLDEVENLLDASFDEVKAADRRLTDIAVDFYTAGADSDQPAVH